MNVYSRFVNDSENQDLKLTTCVERMICGKLVEFTFEDFTYTMKLVYKTKNVYDGGNGYYVEIERPGDHCDIPDVYCDFENSFDTAQRIGITIADDLCEYLNQKRRESGEWPF